MILLKLLLLKISLLISYSSVICCFFTNRRLSKKKCYTKLNFFYNFFSDICTNSLSMMNRNKNMTAPIVDAVIFISTCLQLLDYTKFFTNFNKCIYCSVKVFTFMTCRQLDSDSSLSFRNHRIIETGYINTFFLHFCRKIL